MDTEEVVLEKIQIAVTRIIPRDLLQHQELVVSMADPWGEELAIRLQGFIWGRSLQPVEYSWPKDWWEHFKERWFPIWAKHRWPVRRRHIKVEWKEVYPNFRAALRSQTVSVIQQKGFFND